MALKNEKQPTYDFEQYIGVAINILSLSSRIDHSMSVMLKKFNLTLPQFNTLHILGCHYPEALALKGLTEKMIDKSSNTSRLVDRLEEKKLASRQVSVADRRVIFVSITKKGLELMDEVSEILELSLEKQLCSEENKETEELIDCLKRLRESV
jgi:DNA-binding MarR family transcriptional regulator